MADFGQVSLVESVAESAAVLQSSLTNSCFVRLTDDRAFAALEQAIGEHLRSLLRNKIWDVQVFVLKTGC